MKERFARIIYVMYYICMAWLFETDLNRHNRQNCQYEGAPDKPCGVGRADANPKLLLNDT